MIFGSNSTMGIGVAVTLRDNFTNKANAVSASMGRMHDNVRKVMTENLRAVRNLSLGVATAGLLMLAPINKAVSAASNFNYIMAAVGAVTQDNLVSLDKLHDQALRISKETIHTANEIGDAMKFLGMAGFNTRQISESIRAVSYLGAATDTKIGGMGGGADILSNIMQQFNVDAKESMRVADLLVATTTRANTNLTQLGEAVYYSGGQFAALKVPMEEVLAMAGVMAGAGYRGSFAGTAMMNMAQQLVKGLGEFRTGRQSKIIEQMGLTPQDVFRMKDGIIQLKPFYEIIANMSAKIQKGVPGAAQMEGFFRKRGMRAFVALLRDPKIGMNLEKFTKFLQTGAAGSAIDVAEERINNFYGKVEIMKSAWNTFRIVLGEALIPVLTPFVTLLTSIANVLTKIVSNPIGKWVAVAVVAFGAAVTIGATLLFVFSSIATMAMSSTVTFANMGRSLVWAWNSAAAAAMRYGLIQKGINNDMVLNSAGRWISKSTGRFVKGPAAGGLMGRLGGIGGILSSAAKWFTKMLPALRGLVPLLGRAVSILTGPIGWVITIVTALVGVKNLINGIIYAFGTIIQSLFFIGEVLYGIGKNLFSPWNWGGVISDAKERFKQRQETLRGSLDVDKGRFKTDEVLAGRKGYSQEFADELSRRYQQMELRRAADSMNLSMAEAQRRQADGTLKINSTLTMDSKVVAENQQEYDDRELARLLE